MLPALKHGTIKQVQFKNLIVQFLQSNMRHGFLKKFIFLPSLDSFLDLAFPIERTYGSCYIFVNDFCNPFVFFIRNRYWINIFFAEGVYTHVKDDKMTKQTRTKQYLFYCCGFTSLAAL